MTIARIVAITVLLQTSLGQGTCLLLFGVRLYVAALSRKGADLGKGVWDMTDLATDGFN